jgi:hypothetical protein
MDGLLFVASLAIRVAQVFLNNWSNIEPFVMGIAAAFLLIQGPMYAIIGYAYLAAQAMRVWAAATAILNAVMAINPIFLVILAIGLLIGAAIWVVQNWEMVSAFFSTLWQNIVQGLSAAMTWVAQGARDTLTQVAQFFINLIPQALEWGATLIRTFVDGILSMKSYLVDGITNVFSAVRKLMPFSDAKEGPFSQLTYSGGAIMSTMAQGVTAQAGTLHSAMGTAFSQAPSLESNATVTAAAVSGSGIPISAKAAPGGTTRTITIAKLIENLIIQGTDKDAQELAEEVIAILHDRLLGADDIITEEMGALL